MVGLKRLKGQDLAVGDYSAISRSADGAVSSIIGSSKPSLSGNDLQDKNWRLDGP
jgi:hypothetical protein